MGYRLVLGLFTCCVLFGSTVARAQMDEASFMSLVVCGSEAEIEAAINFQSPVERQDFESIQRRYQANAKDIDLKIEQALSSGDLNRASILCARADEWTDTFTKSCNPSGELSLFDEVYAADLCAVLRQD